MSALFRDSALGQLIRYATKNKVLLYPEERQDFQCPSSYRSNKGDGSPATPTSATPDEPPEQDIEKTSLGKIERKVLPAQDAIPTHRPESIEEAPPTPATEKDFDLAQIATIRTGLTRVDTRVTMERIHTRRDLEQAYTTATLEKGPTRPIIPEKLEDGTILVDWYDTDDPENPQNWSLRKKAFITFQIW